MQTFLLAMVLFLCPSRLCTTLASSCRLVAFNSTTLGCGQVPPSSGGWEGGLPGSLRLAEPEEGEKKTDGEQE